MKYHLDQIFLCPLLALLSLQDLKLFVVAMSWFNTTFIKILLVISVYTLVATTIEISYWVLAPLEIRYLLLNFLPWHYNCSNLNL